MAQFRQFLVVVLPALAAGFSLNVKPKEWSQQRSAAEAAAVGCTGDEDDCGSAGEYHVFDPSQVQVSWTIDAISGRRLHTVDYNDVAFANCNDRSECCPYGGGASDDGGSWSGESEGPDVYGYKRVKCDHECDTGCDEGGYSCNHSCGPHLALQSNRPQARRRLFNPFARACRQRLRQQLRQKLRQRLYGEHHRHSDRLRQ